MYFNEINTLSSIVLSKKVHVLVFYPLLNYKEYSFVFDYIHMYQELHRFSNKHTKNTLNPTYISFLPRRLGPKHEFPGSTSFTGFLPLA